jgi:hypothetical protein
MIENIASCKWHREMIGEWGILCVEAKGHNTVIHKLVYLDSQNE